MKTQDMAILLGSALRTIRKRTTGTQDEWASRTGMAQSYTSAVERGASGWESMRNIAAAVELAGGDPLDLLRLAVEQVDLPEDQAEMNALWREAAPDIKTAVLTLLRSRAGARVAAR